MRTLSFSNFELRILKSLLILQKEFLLIVSGVLDYLNGGIWHTSVNLRRESFEYFLVLCDLISDPDNLILSIFDGCLLRI
jgi:hypothetical protein